jgi:hypothetical protein
MPMRAPAAPRLENKARVRRILKTHLAMAAGVAAYLLLVRACPVQWLFGVPCPGCGMTRAHLALLRLDFADALYYHPLVFVTLPALLYLAHQDAWKLPGGRRARRILLAALCAAFLGVYLVRLFLLPDSPLQIDWENAALHRLFETVAGWFG